MSRSSPSMPLLTDVCLRVAEAAVTMHQSTHIIKQVIYLYIYILDITDVFAYLIFMCVWQLWELYAVEFSQKFPAVSAALLASLLRCIDGTLAADMGKCHIIKYDCINMYIYHNISYTLYIHMYEQPHHLFPRTQRLCVWAHRRAFFEATRRLLEAERRP